MHSFNYIHTVRCANRSVLFLAHRNSNSSFSRVEQSCLLPHHASFHEYHAMFYYRNCPQCTRGWGLHLPAQGHLRRLLELYRTHDKKKADFSQRLKLKTEKISYTE